MWLLRVVLLCIDVVYMCWAINPPTVVIDLNEKFVEVKDEGFWLVEFYAPWCAHCKRLLPIWEHVGHAVSDKNLPVRIAKMDCTRFSSACNSLGIQGYPTILFFRRGRRIDYNGERTKDALFNFAVKCSAPVIESVTAVRLNEVRRDSRNDPAFLIMGEERDEFLKEYESIADSLFSKTRFFSARPESVPNSLRDSGSRIAVLKDDKLFYYKGNLAGLRRWVMSERWPLMPRAFSTNMGDLSTSGKLIVLVVSSELERFNQSSPIGIFYGKVVDAAEDMRKLDHLWERFQFAWLDGSDIANNIVLGTVDIPGILVFNYTTYEYFLSEDEPDKMTKASILTWLSNLADGIEKEQAIPLGGRSWLIRIKRMIWELYTNVAQMFTTQPLLSSCLFGVPIAFFSIICYSICSADFTVDREEFYPDDEDEDYEVKGSTDEHLTDPNHAKNE